MDCTVKDLIRNLSKNLARGRGNVFFEYAIPRMGKRVDVILLLNGIVFVLEFKVGEASFSQDMQLIRFLIMHWI